jgi:hypothetical protein
MDTTLPVIKNLPGKSFVLSAALHVLAFSTFIFVWPKQSVEPKPHFNFLGSILSVADVVIPSATMEQESAPSVNYQFQDTPTSLFETRLPKPLHRKQYAPEEKRTVKEIKTEVVPPPMENFHHQDVPMETEIEPYKPLRLKAND